MSKAMIIDGRGEHPSKLIDIKYQLMCQIHETVFPNQLFTLVLEVNALSCETLKLCLSMIRNNSVFCILDDRLTWRLTTRI